METETPIEMRLNAVPKDSPQYELCQDALTIIEKYKRYANCWSTLRLRISTLEGVREAENWLALTKLSNTEMVTGLGSIAKAGKTCV